MFFFLKTADSISGYKAVQFFFSFSRISFDGLYVSSNLSILSRLPNLLVYIVHSFLL